MEERIRFFYLRYLSKLPAEENNLSASSVILNREERRRLPPPKGAMEAALFTGDSILKKSLLSAQIRDCLTSYVDSLRMRDTTVPETIRSSLSARLDPLLKEGIAQLQQVLQTGLGRNLTADQLIGLVSQAFGRFSQRVSDAAEYHYAKSSWYQLLKCYADSGMDRFVYLLERKERTCDRCSSQEGSEYTLEELVNQNLLPPLHPNCGCTVAPAAVIPTEDAAVNNSIWEPLRRIPDDAKALILGYADAQYANFKSITGAGDVLNYLLLGVPGSVEDGLKARADAMMKAPNWYTIGNWLTMGLFDLVKGTFFPDESLSLEHWLNSLFLFLSVSRVYAKVQQNYRIKNHLSHKKFKGYTKDYYSIDWDVGIKATQERIPGTNIPKSFSIEGWSVNGIQIWVHPNATKHMGEYIKGSGGSILVENELMNSFKTAINHVLPQIRSGKNFFSNINGWEIGINGDTGVIYHALYKGGQ